MRRVTLGLIASILISTVTPSHATSLVRSSYSPYLGDLSASTQEWFTSAFVIYKRAFIRPNGRVRDPQNAGITYSESQGYGMMLALLGNDPATFERVWRFTRRSMQRPDGLFSWKYVPGQGITDVNNATDGELLIATALALASMRWERGAYMAEAKKIARAVGELLILEHGSYTILLPGEWARPSADKPDAVVNLSYFIPIALPILEGLAPDYPWATIANDSRRMLDGLVTPPSDWSSINSAGELVPAAGYPSEFGYNAVRIPLYLLQSGEQNPAVTKFLFDAWEYPLPTHPFAFNVTTMEQTDTFFDNAYLFTYELLRCVEKGDKVSNASTLMNMTNYYGSSLHLMAFAAMYAHYPQCFPYPDALL